MFRQTRRVLMVCVAAASAVVLSATPSVAHTTISIDNPHDPTNPHGSVVGGYTAHSDETILTDFDTGAQFICTTTSGVNASDASGTILDATSEPLPHTVEDAVTGLTFNNCTSSFGSVDVDAIGNHDPYDLVIETNPGHLPNGSEADGVGRVVSSTNTPLAHVEVSFCSFDVIGEAAAAYLNEGHPEGSPDTGQLVLDPALDPAETGETTGLRAANVSSCFGQVNNGDELGYEAVYDIDDPNVAAGDPSSIVTGP